MCGVLCWCAELSCFAVAPCAQTMVSEDVCLALAFIILLRLAGISHCYSTHSALGPLFAVWLPCFGRRVCPRFPLGFSALGAFLDCGPSSVRPGMALCFHRCGFCLLGLVSSLVWLASHLRSQPPASPWPTPPRPGINFWVNNTLRTPPPRPDF